MSGLLRAYKTIPIPSKKVLLKVIFLLMAFSGIFKYSAGQDTYVIGSKEVNIRQRATLKSAAIGKAHYGDTILSRYATREWVAVQLNNGRTGYIQKKNLQMVLPVVQQIEIRKEAGIDMSAWSFQLLLSATIKYFLLLTVCILFILLTVYYFK